jgi:hypothetical protein
VTDVYNGTDAARLFPLQLRRAATLTSRTANGSRTREPDWVELPDQELLELRLCDLGLKIEGSVLDDRISRLYDELEYRHLRFRPHFWLSEEWFSPDGTPGIAIPFFLAHPRLARLERKMMYEVEGGSEAWCMRILRHETGHTFDTAYRLSRRKAYREIFGRASEPYPDTYQPKPYSKSFVLHLDMWYAQSHPCEDFAETFAVWLKPRSAWRVNYREWPAIKKLEYVDALMQEIAAEKPQVSSKEHIEPLKTLKKTLREHYQEKRDRYQVDYPNVYDRELRRLFSDRPEHAKRPSAATFLRNHADELSSVVAQWTGQYRYTIHQVLDEIINRCRELKLHMDRSESAAKRDALAMLTVQTMNYLHGGYHRVAL